jgi:hypothetical protein
MRHHHSEPLDIHSYDDLQVHSTAGSVQLECPACGPIETPRRAPTLSDLTNAAIEHLAERHPHPLALAAAS